MPRPDPDAFEQLYRLHAGREGYGHDEIAAMTGIALQAWWDALPGSPGTPPWWQVAAVRLAAWLGLY